MSAGPSSRANKFIEHCNNEYAPAHNKDFAKLGTKSDPKIGPQPQTQIAIITCMDARIDVFKMFNLSLGDAHVIRNGGGRAADALRSLIASEQVLKTNEVMVVHHTDCGFQIPGSFDTAYQEMRDSLGISVDHIPLMPITNGLEASVKDDVDFLKRSPYVKNDAIITGWIYDTFSGEISNVC